MARRRGIDLRWDSIKTHEGIKPNVFAWLARTGIGVRSGSRPSGWVQIHNMAALNVIEDATKANGGDLSRVFVRGGHVFAGSKKLGSARSFYDLADARARR